MRFSSLIVSLALAWVAGAVQAHEFWIDPETYFVEPGEPIVADGRTGDGFRGAPSIYSPSHFRRFEILSQNDLSPVEGKLGERPFMTQTAPEGLAVVIHQTADFLISYESQAKFEKFLTHKDALWVLEDHKARGLPEAGFTEVFSRYAKALVAVGAGAGKDQPVGLLTEIVALANPYTDDVSGGVPVRVLFQGRPRADVQLEVFEDSPDGEVTVTFLRTDGRGEVTVPVKPGHQYMLDAVILREPDGPSGGAVWESLWANLTFAVPG